MYAATFDVAVVFWGGLAAACFECGGIIFLLRTRTANMLHVSGCLASFTSLLFTVVRQGRARSPRPYRA